MNWGEFLQHTLNVTVNVCNTLLVIVRMNLGEFLQHSLSNFDGELR